jgi:hypothetical protein
LEYIKLDFEAAGILWTLFKCLRAPTSKDLDIGKENTDLEDMEERFGFYIPETLLVPTIGI